MTERERCPRAGLVTSLPGGPGIDPAGIMTGARGASLKRDAKAKVTPSRCIARSAAWIELRQMAEASAAVERRKASALRSARGRAPQSTDDWCAFSALRLPLFFLEAKDWWLWSAKPGRGRRRGKEMLHPPLQGEGRAPQVRGVGCAAAQGVAARLRALSPHPAALWAATFPLQGKVQILPRHIFSKRLALPLRILALSSSDSGTVCIHSSAGGFMTNGQSTAKRI